MAAPALASRFSRKGSLTRSQLMELKKGPKANVVIGTDDDRFIGLEGAAVNLLAHFSPYAQQKLIQERGTVLCIPNGSKKAVAWIYKYMQTGENDPPSMESFEALNFDSLVQLYRHCDFLDYKSLTARIVGRFKGMYYDSLPSTDEIKVFAASIPPLYTFAIDCLAKEMINPWTCDYAPYLKLADAVSAFGTALGNEMQKLLVHRIKVGKKYYKRTTSHQVLWSKRYLDDQANRAKAHVASTSKKPTKQSKLKKHSKSPKPKVLKTKADVVVGGVQDAEDLQAHASPVATQKQKAKSKKPVKCFKCSGEGHIARNCDVEAKAGAGSSTVDNADTTANKSARAALVSYDANKPGHIIRNHSVEESQEAEGLPATLPETKRPGRRAAQKGFTCFNCGEPGHIARNCTTEGHVVEDTARRTRDTTGRNKSFRRAQRDRAVSPIFVTGNGEGLRTCDREVKKGEMTRTGLHV